MSDKPEEAEDGTPLPWWARVIRGMFGVLIPLGMLTAFVSGAVWGLVHGKWYSYLAAGVCGFLMWAWVAAFFAVLAEASKNAE